LGGSNDTVRSTPVKLQQRLERLERDNRRFKRVGLALMLLAGVGMVMGQNPAPEARVVKAEKFVVVDKNGVVLATLGADKEETSLKLHSPDGKPLISLRAWQKGSSGLYIEDEKGTPAVELAHIEEGGPVLHFIGSNSATRVSLEGTGQSSSLSLYQREGQHILTLQDGTLKLYDGRGRNVVFEKP
jgi:hypothetical protein